MFLQAYPFLFQMGILSGGNLKIWCISLVFLTPGYSCEWVPTIPWHLLQEQISALPTWSGSCAYTRPCEHTGLVLLAGNTHSLFHLALHCWAERAQHLWFIPDEQDALQMLCAVCRRYPSLITPGNVRLHSADMHISIEGPTAITATPLGSEKEIKVQVQVSVWAW